MEKFMDKKSKKTVLRLFKRLQKNKITKFNS
jgi:hypothetical protein